MSEDWTPPIDCIFLGTVEQFRDEAFRRLTKLGGNCQRINNPPGISIYRYSSEISNENPWLRMPLCHIVAEGLPPGNRCHLDFRLAPNEKAKIYDWRPAREQIELLLENLRRVGWIETKPEQSNLGASLADTDQESLNLWERIPDTGYDRKLVELWDRGETVLEIAKKVGKPERTIEGRMRTLRNRYKETIPDLLPSRKA